MDHSVQNPVINFIDEVNKQNALDKSYDAVSNDPNIKLRKLGETKRQGKMICMNSILSRLCSNSIPEINGRIANTPDLDKVVSDYIAKRTGGRDIDFYVKEAIKRNPKRTEAIKSIYESVSKIVDDMYLEKELHPESITKDDFAFNMTPAVEDKLTAVIRDNNLDSLSDVIKDNVRANAITEVELAKKEREDRLALEDELMNDDSITTEAALEEALKARGLNERKIYEPTLFEAVMNSKFKEISTDNYFGDFTYTCESDYCLEGVLADIKNKITGHTEEAVSKAIEKEHAVYLQAVEKSYNVIYSEYRSEVSPVNIELITKNLKKIITSPKVGNITFRSRVNPSIVKATGEEYRNNAKSMFISKKYVKFDIIRSKKDFSVSDAITEALSCVNALDTFFTKPDVKDFVNKRSAFVNGKTKGCESAAEVKAVYKIAVDVDSSYIAYYAQAIEFVESFVKFAKKLMSKYNNDAVKEAAFDSAIVEYTMLNISKALYLESFGIFDLPKVIESYK